MFNFFKHQPLVELNKQFEDERSIKRKIVEYFDIPGIYNSLYILQCNDYPVFEIPLRNKTIQQVSINPKDMTILIAEPFGTETLLHVYQESGQTHIYFLKEDDLVLAYQIMKKTSKRKIEKVIKKALKSIL